MERAHDICHVTCSTERTGSTVTTGRVTSVCLMLAALMEVKMPPHTVTHLSTCFLVKQLQSCGQRERRSESCCWSSGRIWFHSSITYSRMQRRLEFSQSANQQQERRPALPALCSTGFYCVLLYYVWFYCVLLQYILFCCILLCSIVIYSLLCSVLLCSADFLLCSVVFC